MRLCAYALMRLCAYTLMRSSLKESFSPLWILHLAYCGVPFTNRSFYTINFNRLIFTLEMLTIYVTFPHYLTRPHHLRVPTKSFVDQLAVGGNGGVKLNHHHCRHPGVYPVTVTLLAITSDFLALCINCDSEPVPQLTWFSNTCC